VGAGDVLGAVASHPVGTQTVAHRVLGHAVGAGDGCGGQRVELDVRSGALRAQVLGVGERGQLGGGGAPLGQAGAGGEDPVGRSDLGQARTSQVDADGTGSLEHVGLLDQLPREGIGDIVDAGRADALVDAPLRGGVGAGAAVPVQVVIAHVEHRGGLAVQV